MRTQTNTSPAPGNTHAGAARSNPSGNRKRHRESHGGCEGSPRRYTAWSMSPFVMIPDIGPGKELQLAVMQHYRLLPSYSIAVLGYNDFLAVNRWLHIGSDR